MKRLKLPGMDEVPGLYGRHLGDLRYMRGSIANREVSNTSLDTIDTTLPELPKLPGKNDTEYWKRQQALRDNIDYDFVKENPIISSLIGSSRKLKDNEKKAKELAENFKPVSEDYIKEQVVNDINQRQELEKRKLDKYTPNIFTNGIIKNAQENYDKIEEEKTRINETINNPNTIQKYQLQYEKEQEFKNKQQEVQAQGGLMKGLGRAWYKASDSVMPGAVDKNSKLKAYDEIDTGSKIGNIASDFVGNTIGLAMPTGNSGVSEMNVADDFAEFGAKKLMPKVATRGQRIAQNVVRGSIDGAIGGTIDTAREYMQTGEFKPVENIAMGTVGGAAMFGGSKALGEGMDHIKTLRDINSLGKAKDITVPQKPQTAIYDTQVPGPKVEPKVETKTEAPKEPVMEQPQNLGSKVNTKFGDGVLIGREGSKLKVAFEDGTTKTINKSKATITTEQVPIPEIKATVKQEPVQEPIKPIEDIKQQEEIKPITEPNKAPKSNKTVLEKNVEDLEQEIMLGEQMGYPKRELENLKKDLELAKAERDKYLPQLKTPTVEAPTNNIPKIETPKANIVNPGNSNYNLIPNKPDIPRADMPKTDLPIPEVIKTEQDRPVYRIKKEPFNEKFGSVNLKDRLQISVDSKGNKRRLVSKPSVKPIQMDHPELAPYIQERADIALKELETGIKGERFHNGKGGSEDNVVMGTSKEQSPFINAIFREFETITEKTLKNGKKRYKENANITYSEIEKALRDIVKDNGAENYAIAKRIENLIDQELTHGGYIEQKGFYESETPPNADYIDKRKFYEDVQNGKIKMPNRINSLDFSGYVPNKPQLPNEAKVEAAPTKAQEVIKEAPKVETTKQEPKNDLDKHIDTLKSYIEVNKKNLKLDYTDKQVINKKIKGYYMQIAALERQKIQGDSLESIPGGLTAKELEAKKKKLASNYVGKTISTPDGKAEIVGNSFGKVRAKLENGEVKSYTKEQVKDYTIPEKQESKLDMQLFGAKTENGKPVSEFKTNTLKESEFLQNEKAQETIDDIAMTFDIKTNKATLQNAKEELDFDTQSTIDRIAETGLEDAEDVVAAAIITNDLVVKGDYNSLKSWLKIVQPEITNIAQSLQAVSVWKKITPEGTLLKAQKIVDIVNKKLETENPIAFKEATTKIEELEKQIKDLQSKLDKKKATGTGEATGSKTKKTKAAKTPEELKIIELEKEIQKLINKNKMAQLTETDIKFITESMKKYNELPKDSIEQRETLAIVKKLMGEKIPPTLSDKLLAYQRINLLGNTKTMVRNVGGNVFMGILENAKDVPGMLIDKGISKLTESNLGKKLPSELRGQRTLKGISIKEQGKGLVEGYKQTNKDFQKGIDTSRLQGQYEIPQAQAFRLKKGELKHIVNNTMSRAEKLVNYGLKIGDTPFVEAAYRGELYNQMKINGTKEVTDDMIQKALDVAADRTFQNTTNLVNQMKKIQKAMNLGKDFGVGNIVMPYVKTPANILDKAVDYSPIGGIKGMYNLINGMKKGTLDQRKVVNQLSRGLTGSTLMYLGYKLAESGVLTGSGPEDMEAAAIEKQSGKMPYSLKIGNTYSTIDWIQPFSIPLMIGADTYKGKKNEDGITKTIYNAIVSGGSTLFDQSLLSGVADLFKGYEQSGGKNFMQGLAKTSLNAATQMIPFNSAMKQAAQLTDSKQRDTSGDGAIDSTVRKSMSNIPILSKMLPEKVDTVGNAIGRHNGSKGIGYVLNTLVNPGQVTNFNPSEAEKLALNLYEATGETKQMPRLADKDITYTDKDGNKAKYKLTAAEKNELQKVMGKTTEKYFAEYYSKNKGKKMQDPVQDLQTLLTKIEKAAKEDFLYKKGLID